MRLHLRARPWDSESAPPPNGADVVGRLEPAVTIEGKMWVTSGALYLNAHFKGEISSEGSALIGEHGEAEGEICAKTIQIVGKVRGTLRAEQRVEIKGRGVVLGNIHAPVLVVEPGGYFDGQCHAPSFAPGSQPATHADSKNI